MRGEKMSLDKISDIGQVYKFTDTGTFKKVSPDKWSSTGNAAPAQGTTGSTELTQGMFFNKLTAVQDVKAKLSEVAASIRKADVTMDTIGRILAKMKSQLETVVKNYPPFPKDSSERVRMLESFAALRREIDKLTIPPDDEGAVKIMADPGAVPEAGDWEVTIGGSGQKMVIHGQPVHTGQGGLDIPELSVDASDEEVAKMAEKINSAEKVLQSRRSGLATNTATDGT